MPFFILLFLFIFVPVFEISLLINIGKTIGGFNTIAFVIFTAILGAYLVKQQGIETMQKVQKEMNSGRMPAMQMAEGVALLFAGAVLLTPGFLTDAIGFALLVPFIRQTMIAWVAKKGIVKTQTSNGGFTGDFQSAETAKKRMNDSNVIEGEYTEPK